MIYNTLGRTGMRVSRIAFGAGPVAGLMTGDDRDAQLATIQTAIDLGINWFDTAAGYGDGKSEVSLGRALTAINRSEGIHVATKVRIAPDDLGEIRDAIWRSVEASVTRLGRPITLLQLHNGLTSRRGHEPFSITPEDVLKRRGVVDAFRILRDEGVVRFVGLTGTGEPAALREVVRSGAFDTLQVPFNMLNPSARGQCLLEAGDPDYGFIIEDCTELNLGVFAIRVFAGGALLDREPSEHTQRTPFFPLTQYVRDRKRALSMVRDRQNLKAFSLRFVIDDTYIHSAIIGFANAQQVKELVELANVQ